LFHSSTFFGSCIIHILHIGCGKIKKKFRRQRVKEKRGYRKWREEVQVALSGELALEEVVDMSEGRLCRELSMLDV
jgi:hypothetical protein